MTVHTSQTFIVCQTETCLRQTRHLAFGEAQVFGCELFHQRLRDDGVDRFSNQREEGQFLVIERRGLVTPTAPYVTLSRAIGKRVLLCTPNVR